MSFNESDRMTPPAPEAPATPAPTASVAPEALQNSALGHWLLTGAGVMAWRGLRKVPPAALLAGVAAAAGAYLYQSKRKARKEATRKAERALSLAETRDATEKLASAWGAHLSTPSTSSGVGKVRPGGAPAPGIQEISGSDH